MPAGDPTPPTPDLSTWPSWTVLAFLNGDNDLDPDAVADFDEMAQVGSNDRLNIIVELDGYGHGSTKRYRVAQNDTVASAAVQTLAGQNMGDPNVLPDFIVWAVPSYPADHYLLVIWAHRDGWRLQQDKIIEAEAAAASRGATASIGIKAVSHDETDSDILYMHEVGQALAGAQSQTNTRLDIVGFDACLMGMIEVAYEIRNNADFMIGSEETEPADGWPYDAILTYLTASFPTRTPSNQTKAIVQRYGDSNGTQGSETQAAYDLSQISTMTGAISGFVRTHNGLAATDKEWAQVGTGRLNTETFHSSCPATQCWGVDIADFAKEAGTRISNTDVKLALLGLELARGRFVIASYHGKGHPDASGVAIYFPPGKTAFLQDGDHSGYEDSNTNNPVAFVKDFKWITGCGSSTTCSYSKPA